MGRMGYTVLIVPRHALCSHLLVSFMPVEGGGGSCSSAPGHFGVLGLPSALLSPEGILRLEGAVCFFIGCALPI